MEEQSDTGPGSGSGSGSSGSSGNSGGSGGSGDSGGRIVAVVGAGLVGSLEACLLAQRGYEVHLYESRDDIRKMDHVPGRSINLAMSVRGRSALRQAGVEDEVIARHGIPMRGRMIHAPDGSTKEIPYNREGQCIYSVGRRFVNEVLLNRAQTFPNLHFHFLHRLTAIDLTSPTLTFTNPTTKETVVRKAALVVGCDGAHSVVRKAMLKRPRFNYTQEYIPHGYMELCIPATAAGEFAMPPNFLHIWPRGEYMMIALPNQDKSWTVTLFMPFHIFEQLTTPQKLINFFQENYGDSVALIGREKLVHDFFGNTPQPMISVKCSPYHVGATSIILGDAAHAMVPFYGQGMNCGMEDCLVLEELLDEFKDDLEKVLPAYSCKRSCDAHAIVDLAMYNYTEMRDLVNSPLFMLRKRWDNLLNAMFPRLWVPLYTMVTFSREPYHLCVTNRKWQDKVVHRLLVGTAVVVAVVAVATVRRCSTGSLVHVTVGCGRWVTGLVGKLPWSFAGFKSIVS